MDCDQQYQKHPARGDNSVEFNEEEDDVDISVHDVDMPMPNGNSLDNPSSSDDDTSTSSDFLLSDASLDTDGLRLAKAGSDIYAFKPLELIRYDDEQRYPMTGLNTSPFYPAPRSGHRVVATASHLYVLGGYNPEHYPYFVYPSDHSKLYQELWSYNFATKTWHLLMDRKSDANMPEQLASHALTICNNVLISHGGTDYPFGNACTNDCFVYTIGENPVCTRLDAIGDLPAAQYGLCMVLHDKYLYTIGGTSGLEYVSDVHRLDLTTKVWQCIYISHPEEDGDPDARFRHELAYDGSYIYVLGGGNRDRESHNLNIIPGFDLKTHRWKKFDALPDTSPLSTQPTDGFPAARKCFSCVQCKTDNGDVEVFITGGMQSSDGDWFSDVWRLNLRAMQWTRIQTATLPHPRFFHSAAHAGNGCMYIFGGTERKQNRFQRRNDVYKMWLTIPKLSEICWDAITHYHNRNLAYYDRDNLLKLGTPLRFVERIEFFDLRECLPYPYQGCDE